MKIITGGRGTGITTDLVLESSKFDIPIVCDGNSVKYIKELAKEMNIVIPEPIPFNRLDRLRDLNYDSIIINDIDCLLKIILYDNYSFKGKVTTVGISMDCI